MMQAPVILYDNVLNNWTTYTASTASSSVPNLRDWRTHTFWTATSTGTHTIDLDMGSTGYPIGAIGIASHNIPVGSTVRVLGSSDAVNYSTYLTLVTQSTNAIFSTFAQVGRSYYRISIDQQTTASKIGVLCLGVPMQMPKAPVYGYSPFDRKTEYQTNRSNGGVMLGANMRTYGFGINAQFTNLPTSFFWTSSGADSTMMSFWNNHAKDGKPFFYSFSPDTYPTMAALVKLADNYTLSTPMYGTQYIQQFGLDMEGVNNP